MFDLDTIDAVETPENDLEEVVMGLIINSGQARSLAYGALKQAKQGDFAAAKAMMEQSRQALSEAHRVQTQLIESDEGEAPCVTAGVGCSLTKSCVMKSHRKTF